MPTVLLVTGGTGAGKTRWAIAEAARSGGLRLSIDDWMARLFWMDAPPAPDIDWALARIARCEAVMAELMTDALGAGRDVILDLGFTEAAHRADWAARARGAGGAVRLVWLDRTPDERWARVAARNAARGPGWAMDVDPAMFAFMEGRFQPPSPREMADCDGVRRTDDADA